VRSQKSATRLWDMFIRTRSGSIASSRVSSLRMCSRPSWVKGCFADPPESSVHQQGMSGACPLELDRDRLSVVGTFQGETIGSDPSVAEIEGDGVFGAALWILQRADRRARWPEGMAHCKGSLLC